MTFTLLGGVAEKGLEITEPLDLGQEGAGVPDDGAEPPRLKVGRVKRRRAGDGEVGALLEVLAVRLRRRRQRQPEMLSCKSTKDFHQLKGKKTSHHRLCCCSEILNKKHITIQNATMQSSETYEVNWKSWQ